MAENKKCEVRCRFCPRRWESDEIEDAPYWGVVYSICSTCYTKIIEEFEKQFPRRRAKVLRIEKPDNDDGA